MMNLSQNSGNKSLFLLILSLLVLMGLSVLVGLIGIVIASRIKDSLNTQNTPPTELSTKCTDEGGIWLDTTKECERVSEPFCRSVGGTFDACASPCRNKGGKVACIQMCVQVCSFE